MKRVAPALAAMLLACLLGLSACSPEQNSAQSDATKIASTEKMAEPAKTKDNTTTETQSSSSDAIKKIADQGYQRAKWDPIHFKPAIDQATDAQCLTCHQEIMTHKPRETSPAGGKAADSLAWYQTLSTYEGGQEDFHWRHLQSPYSKKVMQMSCTTCHQGNDPREESAVPTPPAGEQAAFTLRRMVNPETVCLMCHGQFPGQNMGLPGKWETYAEGMQNNCLTCHAMFRTNRHKVNFLNAKAIEEEGAKSGDSCYGCHGGRAWYRINFPYPRHTWEGMPPDVPDWAKNRPTESPQRFLTPHPGTQAAAPASMAGASASTNKN